MFTKYCLFFLCIGKGIAGKWEEWESTGCDSDIKIESNQMVKHIKGSHLLKLKDTSGWRNNSYCVWNNAAV